MIVTVERVTETGVLVNGEWWNYSKFGAKPSLTAGATYDIDYKTFRDKKYIQSARPAAGGNAVATEAKPEAAKASSDKTTAKAATPVDFIARDDAKSRRILVQGVVQACLHSPGLVGFGASADEYLAAVEAAARREVSFIEKLAAE